MDHKTNTIDPSTFFKFAIRFEGGLVIVAFILGWMVDVNPISDVKIELSALLWGVVGTLPLFLLLVLFYRYPFGALYSIKRLLIDVLGPCLNICRLHELIFIAILAGVSEELLFRGVLQSWFENLWGIALALLLSNILFGLAHAVTVMYAVLASLIGIYLAAFMDIGEQRNLLIPILIHAFYDFLAFLLVIQSYREENAI